MARQDSRLEAAETELIECMAMLLRMPDREKGWLRSGQASWWPTIARDVFEDWPDFDPAPPRMNLNRRDVARVERMFLTPGCIVERIPRKDRQLVAVVVRRKGGRMPGGFRWDDIWTALRGRLPNADGDSVKVTSARMRERYERALDRIAPMVLNVDAASGAL